MNLLLSGVVNTDTGKVISSTHLICVIKLIRHYGGNLVNIGELLAISQETYQKQPRPHISWERNGSTRE